MTYVVKKALICPMWFKKRLYALYGFKKQETTFYMPYVV